MSLTLCEAPTRKKRLATLFKCVTGLNVPCWPYNTEVAGDGAYDLSSLAKKTRTSNHLQMSLQRQHVFLGLVLGSNPGPPARQSGALPTELTSAHEKYIP